MTFQTDEQQYETGRIEQEISYDYIIDLYQKFKNMKLEKHELEKRVAVLKVLADHVGDYMVVKYKQ